MSKVYEKTFGKLIGNAELLRDTIDGIASFQPQSPTEQSGNFTLLINELKTTDSDEAIALSNYYDATRQRYLLFKEHPDSLSKRFTDINSAVYRQYGRGSHEYKTIAALVTKTRSIKLSPKEKSIPSDQRISRSQQSYDSIMQTFSDIIATLGSYSPTYTPVNARVTIATLQMLRDNLMQATHQVNIKVSAYKVALNRRNEKMAAVKKVALGIKASIKGQYGIHSEEYGLVRKIEF